MVIIFTDPNISSIHKNNKFILGMLPSLRIKNDKSPGTKNSAITPNLGAGLTVIYRKMHYSFRFIITLTPRQKTAPENRNRSWLFF
ncbi:hypothetical protein [Chryseobacterium limigenitum]|uniref:hypothetical protein n=1 Tax=Chryseobacterium limigenitum TaxID=1612149 RepID=UPI00092FF8D0|nr:hypothetical protein [Chryseobacterium limigenitum]